jgi:hypothetical protein
MDSNANLPERPLEWAIYVCPWRGEDGSLKSQLLCEARRETA